MQEVGHSILKARSDLMHYEKSQETYRAHADECRQRYERAMEDLRYFTQKAEEFSERVPVNKPSKYYEDELKRLYSKLKAQARE